MRQAVYIFIAGVGLTASFPAAASSLTYTPTNPTFGGNPLNGTFLLSTAQAQGQGAKSGQSSTDLSGLSSALSGLSSVANPTTIVIGTPTTP